MILWQIFNLSCLYSPRRGKFTTVRVLLCLCCCEIDETPLPDEKGADYVLRMAIEKNNAARQQWQQQNFRKIDRCTFLSADTSVILEDKILGKPKNEADARAMLEPYRREHQGRSQQYVADETKCKRWYKRATCVLKCVTEKKFKGHRHWWADG